MNKYLIQSQVRLKKLRNVFLKGFVTKKREGAFLTPRPLCIIVLKQYKANFAQYKVKIVYFAEMISIVLKKEADSGTMPAPTFTRIMFGLQLKPLTCETWFGFLGKISNL